MKEEKRDYFLCLKSLIRTVEYSAPEGYISKLVFIINPIIAKNKKLNDIIRKSSAVII
ncbi:MAG: hypothetical protein ACTSP9_12030 [Promethearchaeota archaeon]